ncbi:MAG: hypothetical protein ABW224_17380 [Kibdelosporangium sp.]
MVRIVASGALHCQSLAHLDYSLAVRMERFENVLCLHLLGDWCCGNMVWHDAELLAQTYHPTFGIVPVTSFDSDDQVSVEQLLAWPVEVTHLNGGAGSGYDLPA